MQNKINCISFQEKLNKQHGSDSLLLYLLNSVNKLKIQHAVDISKLEAKLQKQEEKYNTEINQLKSLCLSKQQSKTGNLFIHLLFIKNYLHRVTHSTCMDGSLQ